MNNSADRAAVQRLTWVLLLSKSLSSAAFITGATVGTLVGAHLSGQAALAACPAARVMDRRGRSGRLPRRSCDSCSYPVRTDRRCRSGRKSGLVRASTAL